MQRVCIFCGAASGVHPIYVESAGVVGAEIARRGLELVYGGGKVGLMGTVADAALAAGGKVIGVIPRALVEKEIAHRSLTELHVVGSMHERKALMADLADVFVALPGGFGTLDEFCEILTWAQLGFHRKPIAILNVARFYDPLLALFDHCVQEGFVNPTARSLIQTADEPAQLLDMLAGYQPPVIDRWLKREDL